MPASQRTWGRQTVSRSTPQGTEGAVAAARRTSVDAALAMLERGGNAVDAAVAAALVAGVVEPMETTLAGSGHILIAERDKPVYCIDFSARAPRAARADMYTIDTSPRPDTSLGLSTVVGDVNTIGALAFAVPGTVAGLIEAVDQFGVLDRATVLEPAIRAAYDGFEADEYFALEVLSGISALRSDPGASALFLRDGLPPTPSHLGVATFGRHAQIRQPQLARTLERIAHDGPAALYGGEVGRSLIETVAEFGGIVTLDDLASYRTESGDAVNVSVNGATVWASMAPTGGITILQLLETLGAWSPEDLPAASAKHYGAMAEVGWHAFADRYHWLADQQVVPVPIAGMLSPEYANHVADLVRGGAEPPRLGLKVGKPWELYAGRYTHDPWPYTENADERTDWAPPSLPQWAGGTTQVSVSDRDGMTVACTHTATQHFGSKVLCPRTGLLLNAGMSWFNARPNAANSIAPTKRPVSNMGSVIVTRSGEPFAAVGAPGGRRLIHAISQVVWNMVTYGMSSQDALDLPRIDASSSQLLASDRIAPDVLERLREKYEPVVEVAEEHGPYLYEFGRPALVSRHRDGTLQAAADAATREYVATL